MLDCNAGTIVRSGVSDDGRVTHSLYCLPLSFPFRLLVCIRFGHCNLFQTLERHMTLCSFRSQLAVRQVVPAFFCAASLSTLLRKAWPSSLREKLLRCKLLSRSAQGSCQAVFDISARSRWEHQGHWASAWTARAPGEGGWRQGPGPAAAPEHRVHRPRPRRRVRGHSRSLPTALNLQVIRGVF